MSFSDIYNDAEVNIDNDNENYTAASPVKDVYDSTCPTSKSTTQKTVTIQVPIDFPPLEDKLDLRLPLHFNPTPSWSFKHWDGNPGEGLMEIHKAINQDLQELMKSLNEKDGWRRNCRFDHSLVYIPTRANFDRKVGLRFYKIGLANGEEHLWPLIDAQIREILAKHYGGKITNTPSVRYITVHTEVTNQHSDSWGVRYDD